MPSLSDISPNEFRTALTPEKLRAGMLIQAALGIGPLVVFGIALLLAFTRQDEAPNIDALEMLRILTIVVVMMFMSLSVVANLFYKMRFTAAKLEAAYSAELLGKDRLPISATPAEKAISYIRAGMLVRTAMLDGPAMFGIVVLLIAALDGVLFTTSWLWVNAIPLAVHLAVIAVTFPTAERVQGIFETKIQRGG